MIVFVMTLIIQKDTSQKRFEEALFRKKTSNIELIFNKKCFSENI